MEKKKSIIENVPAKYSVRYSTSFLVLYERLVRERYYRKTDNPLLGDGRYTIRTAECGHLFFLLFRLISVRTVHARNTIRMVHIRTRVVFDLQI